MVRKNSKAVNPRGDANELLSGVVSDVAGMSQSSIGLVIACGHRPASVKPGHDAGASPRITPGFF